MTGLQTACISYLLFMFFNCPSTNIKKSCKTLILRDLSLLFRHLSLTFRGETGFPHSTKLPESKSPIGVHCPLKHILKYCHVISFPIFTQSKNFQNPDIKVKGTSAGNAPSNPHLFSVIPYILILLLFRKTPFSFISTFCRVSGNCSRNSFPASFLALSCISSHTLSIHPT